MIVSSPTEVQVRGDDERPALVGCIDEPVERLGSGLPGGQHADVVEGPAAGRGRRG